MISYNVAFLQWWTKKLHRIQVRVDVDEDSGGAFNSELPLYHRFKVGRFTTAN